MAYENTENMVSTFHSQTFNNRISTISLGFFPKTTDETHGKRY